MITKLKLDGYRKDVIRRKVKQKLAGRRAMGLVPSGTKDKKEKGAKEDARVDLD